MKLTLLIITLFLIGNFFPISAFGARIEIFLLATLYFALHYGAVLGTFCGLGFGILEELFSPRAFGTLLIPSVLIGFLAGLFRDKIYFENLWSSFVLVFAAIFFGYIVQAIFFGNFSLFMAYSALFSALISPVMFWIIKRCV